MLHPTRPRAASARRTAVRSRLWTANAAKRQQVEYDHDQCRQGEARGRGTLSCGVAGVGPSSAIGLVGCLVGGCSGRRLQAAGPAGQRRPRATTSQRDSRWTQHHDQLTATTPTATPTKVILPPAATAHTEDGAKAFAAFYVRADGQAAAPCGLSAFSEPSRTPSCTGCRVGIDLADQLQAKGQHTTTTTFTIAGTRLSELTTDTQLVVDVLVDDAGGETVDSARQTGSKISSCQVHPAANLAVAVTPDGSSCSRSSSDERRAGA